jgi:hypothetical protein
MDFPKDVTETDFSAKEKTRAKPEKVHRLKPMEINKLYNWITANALIIPTKTDQELVELCQAELKFEISVWNFRGARQDLGFTTPRKEKERKPAYEPKFDAVEADWTLKLQCLYNAVETLYHLKQLNHRDRAALQKAFATRPHNG